MKRSDWVACERMERKQADSGKREKGEHRAEEEARGLGGSVQITGILAHRPFPPSPPSLGLASMTYFFLTSYSRVQWSLKNTATNTRHRFT